MMNKEPGFRSPRYGSLAFWWRQHVQACLSSLGDIIQKPLLNLMTIAVISFAVALPAGLYLILQNLQLAAKNWDNTSVISLYLKSNTSAPQIKRLLNQLKKHEGIEKTQYISPQKGLLEFATATQIQGIDKVFPQNPLPPVVLVTPTVLAQTPDHLNQLVDSLKRYANVEIVQVDLQWMQRLYYILQISKRLVLALAVLFSVGIIIIIGNTIRLITQSHQREMMILQLIGASYSFVRRPLLYRGLWYGLLGGALAWILVFGILHWVSIPAGKLAGSYGINLSVFNFQDHFNSLIILGSGLLGWLGAWVMAKHYAALETKML